MRHPNCKPLPVHWADIPDGSFDPGIRYSVRTPQGIQYTVIRPAAAHGSSEFIDYVTHQYESRKSNRKRR